MSIYSCPNDDAVRCRLGTPTTDQSSSENAHAERSLFFYGFNDKTHTPQCAEMREKNGQCEEFSTSAKEMASMTAGHQVMTSIIGEFSHPTSSCLRLSAGFCSLMKRASARRLSIEDLRLSIIFTVKSEIVKLLLWSSAGSFYRVILPCLLRHYAFYLLIFFICIILSAYLLSSLEFV